MMFVCTILNASVETPPAWWLWAVWSVEYDDSSRWDLLSLLSLPTSPILFSLLLFPFFTLPTSPLYIPISPPPFSSLPSSQPSSHFLFLSFFHLWSSYFFFTLATPVFYSSLPLLIFSVVSHCRYLLLFGLTLSPQLLKGLGGSWLWGFGKLGAWIPSGSADEGLDRVWFLIKWSQWGEDKSYLFQLPSQRHSLHQTTKVK